MARLKIDIEDSSGNKLGYGPIMSATSWRGTQRLDKAGSFEFSMPLSDPLAALITEDVVLRPYAFVNNAWIEQPGGIVGSLRRRASVPTMLEVSGDDLLRELAECIVRDAGLSSIVEIADWTPVTPDYVGTLETGARATERTVPWSWAMDAGEWLYIGHTSPFNKVSITLGAQVNAHSGAWSYQYYSGNLDGWYSLADVTDGCKVGTDPLAQSGNITWTMPEDWSDTGHDSHNLYWVRFRQPSDGGQLDTVDFAGFTVDERTGAADALDTILGYATGWSLDVVNGESATANPVYLQLAGETVLEALVKVSELTGEHFRLGTGRKIIWMHSATASGVRAINNADPLAVESHDDLALITSLDQSTDYFERVNGVYPYGSGQGNGRLTIADSTDTHAGYTIDRANNHVYWTARTRPIEIEQQWSDIQPAKDTAAEKILAANSLLKRAVQYLSEHKDPQTQWSATLAHVNLALSPGQTIRVVYREVRDGYVAWDIDQDLYVLEANTQIDNNGVRTVALTLSTVQRWALTDTDMLVATIRKARDSQRRPQTLDVANLRYSGLQPGGMGLVGFSAGGRLGPRYMPKHGLYSGWHADTAAARFTSADGGEGFYTTENTDFASIDSYRKTHYYSEAQSADIAVNGAWTYADMAPYTNYYTIVVYKRVVGGDTYYPVFQVVTDDASMTLGGTNDSVGKYWHLQANARINGDLDLNGDADISGSLTVPVIKTGAYTWQTTITKTGLADNVATGVFRITTPNAPGTYIVTVRGMATHSSAGYTSVMRFDASYARAVVSSSVGVTGTLASSSGAVAATSAGNRTVVSVTPTVVENTALQVDFYLQVDIGGSSIGTAAVQMVVELQWQQFTSAPTIAAL